MIGAIVLAAGKSTRMGAAKVLLPFGQSTVIGHIVDQLLAAAIENVVVVAGHERERIAAALSGRQVTLTCNRHVEAGMISSVRCGLQVLPAKCDRVLMALGDQPVITTALIQQVVGALETTDKGIVIPCHGGKRGHPMIFSTRYRDKVMTHYDEVGLRGLPHDHPGDVFELEASSPAVLADMDVPADYRRALEMLEEE